jgi:hypothetical protein
LKEKEGLHDGRGACISKATSPNLAAPRMRQLSLWLSLALSVGIFAGCDPVGKENGRISAVPLVAPPVLSPVELVPPHVDRSVTDRVVLIDPPLADAVQTDVLKQSDGVVDILWVVDDSGSMADERARLALNFSTFVQQLVTMSVDFQMGVTPIVFTGGGVLRGTPSIIDTKTPDPQAVFTANTTFPASRSRWAQGLRMAQDALTSPNTDPGGPNAGFVRPKAALAVIVVTNDEDHSFGTPQYYTRLFTGLKGKGNENLFTFSVIGGTLPNGCTPAGDQGLYGALAKPVFRYAEVAAKTGGVIGSICDASFEQTLLNIAQAINTLKRVFALTLVPIANSISVTVTTSSGAVVSVPNDPVAGFQYRADTNSVVFLGTYVPPPGSTVRITYAFTKA